MVFVFHVSVYFQMVAVCFFITVAGSVWCLICFAVNMLMQMYVIFVMCFTDIIVLACSLMVADPKFVLIIDKFNIYLFDQYAHTKFIISLCCKAYMRCSGIYIYI